MNIENQIGAEFFDRPTDDVAKALIGALLTFKSSSELLGGFIVETEAYDENDPASHTEYKKKNMNKSMYLAAGHLYIYPNSKDCSLNFVCGKEGYGSAVLVRALHPLEECRELMRERRSKQRSDAATNDYLLCSGPVNLCWALGVTSDLDGKALSESPFRLFSPIENQPIWCGPRVGVKDQKHRRYALAGSRWISRYGEKKYPLSVDRC